MRTRSIVWTLALSGALVGCKDDVGDAPEGPGGLALRRLEGCDDLRVRLVEVVTESLVQNRYGWRGVVGMPEDDAAGAPPADGDSGGGEGPTDYSGTNNQEAGVDELDIVKTDGTRLFVASDRALHVLRSWPADQTEKLATVEIGGWVQGAFLVDDAIVVLSQHHGGGGGFDKGDVAADPGTSTVDVGGFTGTRLTVVDVSDPTAPEVERTVDLEGWLADARLIDGKVHLVVNQYIEIPGMLWDAVWNGEVELPEPDWDAPESEWEAAEAAAREILAPRVEAAFASVDVDALLPAWRTAVGEGFEPMYACDDLYVPGVLTPPAMLGVVTFDPADGSVGSAGLMSDGWTVYASVDNLYVAQSSQWWWGWDDEAASAVHKFALGGAGPEYRATGRVEGWLYDQFAMSEHEGFLRVVTTDFTWWWWGGARGEEQPAEPANHVFVLEDDGDGTLEVVGHVGGIAPNERVMAARLLGDEGYVVTFRQTDPLFTLDLSDPTDPKVVGELHMPGYSAYLHPLGDDHLLAVGMAGEDDGTLTGLAINVFDVSDLADPKLVHQHTFGPDGGWSWSEALWDHHAFTFHRGVLTIPTMLESWDEVTGWSGFSGTVSFDVDLEAGITELGRVDHADLVGQSECLYTRWYGWDDACAWEYGYWYARVRRSVVVEDALFTISDYGVKVNELRDPGIELDRVVFYPR